MGRKPTKSETVICRHFRWRLSKRASNGIYMAESRSAASGIDERHSLGTRSRDEALKLIAKLDLEIAIRRGLADPSERSTGTPIGEGVRLFMEAKQLARKRGQFSERSLAKYRQVLDRFEWYCAERTIHAWERLTPHVLQTFLTEALPPETHSANSRNSQGRIVHGVLRYLVEDARRIDRNVLFVFKEEPIEANPHYCFTEQEVAALLERARTHAEFGWMHAPLVTLAYTGLRRGELAALDWEDIDLDAGLLRVRHEPAGSTAATRKTTKGKRTREVGVHEDVAAVLDALPGTRTGPVFLTPRGKRLDPDRFLAAFKRDLRDPLASRFPAGDDAASFRDGVLHSFRHFAADRARRQGMPEEIRLQMFGHRDRETHKVYLHITPKETADAARRLPSLAVTPDPPGLGSHTKSDAGPRPAPVPHPAEAEKVSRDDQHPGI